MLEERILFDTIKYVGYVCGPFCGNTLTATSLGGLCRLVYDGVLM
jgi:hypothetical protein